VAAAGFWNDADVKLSWHPAAKMKAHVQSSLAFVDCIAEFYDRGTHASADLKNGRSAGDALELYTTGINYYREHIQRTGRNHYHIKNDGQVIKMGPDYSRLWVGVRNTD
jgi:aminobenzoyl-glutamate utilization protein B